MDSKSLISDNRVCSESEFCICAAPCIKLVSLRKIYYNGLADWTTSDKRWKARQREC